MGETAAVEKKASKYKASVNAQVAESWETSFAVSQIREEYQSDAYNGEDRARKLGDHIKAVDDTLGALSEERERLEKELHQATGVMHELADRLAKVSADTYREDDPDTLPSRY